MRKYINKIALVLLVLMVSVSSISAGDKPISNSSLSFDKIEQNLLVGLNSDNTGLKISSAYMLGEIQSFAAINPLTKLLRDGNDERVRLAAALSLIKIGTERSVYVVKTGRKLNDLEKVRNLCKHLYNAHVATTFKGQEPTPEQMLTYLYSE